MKKVSVLALVMIAAANNCAGADATATKIAARAAKADKEKDFHSFVFTDNKGVNHHVISHFNLNDHASMVRQTLEGQSAGTEIGKVYNLKPLEMVYCRAAQSTMPFFKRFRGTVGFGFGAALMSMPLAFSQLSTSRSLTKTAK